MRNKSRREACISSIPQGIAYHQHEVLYIIKPQVDARWRVMRYSPEGADDMHRTSHGDDMPRQAAWIKKNEVIASFFFGLPERIRTFDLQSRSLTRYPAEPRADITDVGIL